MNIQFSHDNPLIFDGAMATYYASLPGHLEPECEQANLSQPELIQQIHREYMEAGAMAIKTNTFGVGNMIARNQVEQARAIFQAGIDNALAAAEQFGDRLVFADLGPVSQPGNLLPGEIYQMQIQWALDKGINCFLMETLPDLEGVEDCAWWLKQKNPEAFLAVSFAAGSDGRTRNGYLAEDLIETADRIEQIDLAGLNCMSGPHHILTVLKSMKNKGMDRLVMPNAGYPDIRSERSAYKGDPEYFARKMIQIHETGACALGGCCGTTPEHIARLVSLLQSEKESIAHLEGSEPGSSGRSRADSRFWTKLENGQKVIAVELDPPKTDLVAHYMDGVAQLNKAGADLITIADCPIGRPRADSCLLACKVQRELGIETLPHMTCRDRNLNAARALLTGLAMEGVHNLLLVTGDPVPSDAKDEVKSVFSYNSRKLARYVKGMYPEMVSVPFRMAGALDLNAPRFEIQLRIAKEKEEAGIECFLTQPVLSAEALDNLKWARYELKAKILVGIMPIVSYKNAMFLNNEISGMRIDPRIIDLYKEKDRQESEDVALKVCSEIVKEASPYCDGYYLMTPFQRVQLMQRIMEQIKIIEGI